MEKWEVDIKMKFPGRLARKKMRLVFEWKAFLLAYDLYDVDPEEFLKKDQMEQLFALIYGAASWGRMKRGKKIFFTYEDIVSAVGKLTTNDMTAISEAIEAASMPQWLSGEKKKTKRPH